VLCSGRCTNEENFLAVALARSGLATGNVDAGLRATWDALVEGLGRRECTPDLTRTLDRLEASDTIIVLEGDLATTHPRIALSVLNAVAAGARLVTIGWAPTHLSQLAALHLPLQPWAPLAGITSLQGALAAAWGGAAGRHAPRTGDGASAPAAVTPASLARWLGESRLSAFIIGAFDRDPALLRSAAATVHALAADLVHMGRPEPLILPLPIRSNTRGSFEMGVVPDLLPGQRPLTDEDARARLRRLWGGEPCWARGRQAEEFIGAVEGLVVVGDDIPAFHSSPSDARRALERIDCLVVIDSFLTPTARQAHVVLPMAAFGEVDGTMTNAAGRVQRVRAWGPPPAGVKPGWEILGGLLSALGSGCAAGDAARVFESIQAAIPLYAALDASLLDQPGGSLLPVSGERTPSAPVSSLGDGRRVGAGGARTVLRREGAFDWGEDPLVTGSPTLRRGPVSRKRLNPRGTVAMNPQDAAALGVRQGWLVRLKSAHGETETAVCPAGTGARRAVRAVRLPGRQWCW
jgi:predicted molibdopterin-dependent oxidoreductase YjgC